MPTTLSGVAILDTRQGTGGEWAGELGQGVYVMCHPYIDTDLRCATLNMNACLVRSSFSAGVAVNGVSGSIQGSAVDQVAPRALDDSFGYGIQIESESDEAPTVFHVRSCRVIDAELAGILYYSAAGTVSGSVVSGADLSVVWTDPSHFPVLTGDNVLSGTVESAPSLQTALEPAPAPPPAPPPVPQ